MAINPRPRLLHFFYTGLQGTLNNPPSFSQIARNIVSDVAIWPWYCLHRHLFKPVEQSLIENLKTIRRFIKNITYSEALGQVFKSFFCYGVRLGTKSINTITIVCFSCVKQQEVPATDEITG